MYVSIVISCIFSLSGPVIGHSHAASIQRGLAGPSSIMLAHPVSSPCTDANGGIDFLAIGSSDWLTLRLLRKNQMWKGESTKLQVTEGY